MDPTTDLTLEQEFSLRTFADQVKQMSQEQAQDFLIDQQRLMMLRETTFRQLLKHEWKLDADFVSP